MDMQLTVETIMAQIETDTKACKALITLFDTEREALKERDLDALDKILEHKSAYLAMLEKSAKTRFSWAKNFAQDPSSDTWETLLTQLKQPMLIQSWMELKTLFTTCKQQNEINGRLIARNQQVFSRLVEIVRGQTQAPTLYGSSGAASGYTGSHSVGEA